MQMNLTVTLLAEYAGRTPVFRRTVEFACERVPIIIEFILLAAYLKAEGCQAIEGKGVYHGRTFSLGRDQA